MLITLSQYLLVLENPQEFCRRLANIRLHRKADGEPLFHCGNSAILFKIEHRGRTRRLRCYTRTPKRERMRIIYGENLYEEELCIHRYDGMPMWVDVVVEDWIEGITLDEAVKRALKRKDRAELGRLAEAFDQLAAEMLHDEWAHGDLKPENILVDEQGRLRLIDFDALYNPLLEELGASELGTAAYQHPTRTMQHFDRWLDHFAIALISVHLHALALDPGLKERYPYEDDFLLFGSEEIAAEPRLRKRGGVLVREALLELFAEQCDPLHYRLTQLLVEPCYRLFGLEELLPKTRPDKESTEPLELYIEHGRTGYRRKEEVVIAPLYDRGLEFHEGWAAVALGGHWHYIDTAGRRVYTPPRCQAVKSIRQGVARLLIDGQWHEIKVKE